MVGEAQAANLDPSKGVPTVARQVSGYAHSGMEPYTDADLKRLCPAIFATEPHSGVSARYGFVPTIDVVQAMRKNGFVPVAVNSYARRDSDRMAFTKHLIRFRQAGNKPVVKGDIVGQVVLTNSHDRSSQFELRGGLWRLICSNGLMVSEGARVEPQIIRHTTSAVQGLIEGSERLVKQQQFVFEHVDAMRKTLMTEKSARLFAEAALALRPERAGVIDPVTLLNTRRTEDEGLDVWRVYNRVQENMMRGGQHGITANNRAVVTRGVTGINGDLKINSGLWTLAMEAIAKAATTSAQKVHKTSQTTTA